jgi:hypothetical protein
MVIRSCAARPHDWDDNKLRPYDFIAAGDLRTYGDLMTPTALGEPSAAGDESTGHFCNRRCPLRLGEARHCSSW